MESHFLGIGAYFYSFSHTRAVETSDEKTPPASTVADHTAIHAPLNVLLTTTISFATFRR